MGRKKEVKLEDIAKELEVSIVTVSNALKNKGGVGTEIRKKVQKKANEMGYHIQSYEKKKKSKCYKIGIAVAERYVKEYPSYYMEIYKQIAQVAVRLGHLTVFEVVDTKKELSGIGAGLFKEVAIHGIMIIGEMKHTFFDEVRKNSQVPVVCVDFYNIEEDMDYIITDSFHGMQLVTQLLIDFGHTDIGFLGTPVATKSIMDRYMGYCKALNVNGLYEQPNRVIFDRSEDGMEYLMEFSLPDKLPDAFACNCEKSAMMLIEQLESRGLRIPEDVSVVAFDRIYSWPSNERVLTTYESDVRAIAQISFNTLLKRIERKSEAEGVRVVEGRVVRGNTIIDKRRDRNVRSSQA